MANAEVIDNGSEAARGRKVETIYISSKGERAARPMADVVKIAKRFTESDQEIELDLGKLSNEMMLMLAAFGAHQAGQNAYGQIKDDSDRIDALEARWDTFLSGGWATERQSGPRTSDLMEAAAAVVKDRTGQEVDEKWTQSFQAKIASGEITAKSLQESPKVKAKLDAIKAKRAAERAAKSASAAGSDDSDLDDLLNI